MSETTYTYAGVAKILDIPESKLRYWAQIGFVGPSVRETTRLLFNFQDLVSVKAAKEARGRHPATVKAVPAASADGRDGADEAEEAPAPKKAARSRTRKSA